MKYFYDTEFLEGTQKQSFLGKQFSKSQPTIDLISIGIVSEDNREYYAISKDFNLKEAWNRYDKKTDQVSGDMRNHFPNGKTTKVYWIRENVLKPIFYNWMTKDINFHDIDDEFTYKNFKNLLNLYGKTNKQIAQEIKNFCYSDKETRDGGGQIVNGSFIPNKYPNIELYGYYSAYDHVALCWLFGKMIDLPKGFPMYTIDTKQEYDMLLNGMNKKYDFVNNENEKATVFSDTRVDFSKLTIQEKHNIIKTQCSYPQNTNQHNALEDAKWTRDFYNFIQSLNYNKANRHF